MAEIYIYALLDPRTKQVRYVGETANKSRRWYEHLRYPAGTAKRKWVLDLRSQGLEPLFEILEVVTEETRDDRERFWIEYYGGIQNLLNAHPGGRKNKDYSIIACSLKGRKRPGLGKKIWETRRARGTTKHTQETKDRLSEATRRQFADAEKRAIHAKAMTEWSKNLTDEQREKAAVGGRKNAEASLKRLREWWAKASEDEKKAANYGHGKWLRSLSKEERFEVQSRRTKGKKLGPRPKMAEAMKRIWEERKLGIRNSWGRKKKSTN
jgi:GIY-YIG catalytic domain